jgi:receptor protein-tyrosine kinase
MSDDKGGPDLIQRFAERMKRQQPTPPPAPAQSVSMPPVNAQASAPKPVQVSSVESRPAPPEKVAAAPGIAKPSALPSPDKVKIDFRRMQRLGFIVPDAEEKTLLSEEMRAIKRPLLRKAFATGDNAIVNGNVVMITSSRPAEGKTFTAVNLALSIASERDYYVMLVDSDVYTQAVFAALGVTPGRGLVDVLQDETADLADIILRTNIPNLSIVAAGGKHPQATELLSSHRMARLIEDMASRYRDRIILIDSPPLLASSEPGVLASRVGQVLVVIEQNRTSFRLVERSLAHLQNCAEVSFILNKVETPLWQEDYASHYRYRTNYQAK